MFLQRITKIEKVEGDLEVQVAIASDIAVVSPLTTPGVATILSHLISRLKNKNEKKRLWAKVRKKLKRVPNNGYLEIWLQRVTQPKSVGLKFVSDETICQIVNGETPILWGNEWIKNGWSIDIIHDYRCL